MVLSGFACGSVIRALCRNAIENGWQKVLQAGSGLLN